MSPANVLDPVAAYDRLAAVFPEIARKRERYLLSIEKLIIERIPSGSASLLDVGAGDGSRSMRIAKAAKLTDVVLLEPSKEMIKRAPIGFEVWPIRAEDLLSQDSILKTRERDKTFDNITCLWNVLGHIDDHAIRLRVLAKLGSMINSGGMIFLDVNHRYNAAAYGFFRTAVRILHDLVSPDIKNGDVVVGWRTPNGSDHQCRTYGHVFTDAEVRQLVRSAGLSIEQRIVVDYDNGKTRRFAHQGNFLYVMRRGTSSSDSRNASQTSCTSCSVI